MNRKRYYNRIFKPRMKIKWRLMGVLIVSVCFVMASSGACEYYQYRRDDGTIGYTDNIANIPDNQRDDITVHESVPEEQPSKNMNPEKSSHKAGVRENDSSIKKLTPVPPSRQNKGKPDPADVERPNKAVKPVPIGSPT